MTLNPKDIFLDAIDLPAPQRAAFIERACAGDADLLSAVNSLLSAHDAAAGLFHRESATLGVEEGAARPRAGSPAVGDVIGRYTLKKLLGEGGFGSVFLAQQTEPVVRDVAIKVLRAQAHIEEIVERFEAERQVLAIMEHPGIARVFDAGTTQDGRPFIAMEYVDGEPITDYATRHGLSLTQRLAMFADVCSAVQHAHQKGVIHRDLKPTNILVTTIDGAPAPKVIDFGIAKAIDPEQPVSAVLTQAFQIIGTPQYMAPEQAVAGAKDVDTRSDVYSLGTVLYELVAGVPPFDVERLRRAGLDEICRLIREETPVRPSTRLSTINESPESVANPATRTRLQAVDQEVDWIVMRALEKDRIRRYQSPAELAADIQRHLNHEAVTAGPPSRVYQLRKFVRRHRTQVAAASAVVLTLIATAVIATWLAARAHRAEGVAREAEKVAVDRANEAARQLAKANAISDFTSDLLEGVGPSVARGRDTTILREILTQAMSKAPQELAHQPIVELAVRRMVSNTQLALGDTQPAIDTLEKSFRDTGGSSDRFDRERLRAGIVLAQAYVDDGKAAQALPIIEEVRSGFANSTTQPSVVSAEADLVYSNTLMRLQRYEEGEQVARKARDALAAQGQQETELWCNLSNTVSMHLIELGRQNEAIANWEEELAVERKINGLEHPGTLSVLNNLALTYETLGDLERAEAYYREILPVERRFYEEGHPQLIKSLVNLGGFLLAKGKLEEAAAILEEGYRTRMIKLGATHRFSLALEMQLINLRLKQNRPDDAVALADEWQKHYEEARGVDSQAARAARTIVLGILDDAGKHKEAQAYLEALGPAHITPETSSDQEMRFEAVVGMLKYHLGDLEAARAHAAKANSLLKPDADGRIASSARLVRLNALLRQASTAPTTRDTD